MCGDFLLFQCAPCLCYNRQSEMSQFSENGIIFSKALDGLKIWGLTLIFCVCESDTSVHRTGPVLAMSQVPVKHITYSVFCIPIVHCRELEAELRATVLFREQFIIVSIRPFFVDIKLSRQDMCSLSFPVSTPFLISQAHVNSLYSFSTQLADGLKYTIFIYF